MQQPKPTLQQQPRPLKHHLYRKPSSNTSIESGDSPHIVKKKFLMQRKNTLINQQDPKSNHADFGSTRKLKICDGQKLSYQVIKHNSREKRAQFLEKYAHDPFMRRKFEKSVERFNHSKSKEMATEKRVSWVEPANVQRKLVANVQRRCVNNANGMYTTFREQVKQESQKTVKLINNCKSLVEELRKNRLRDCQDEEKEEKLEKWKKGEEQLGRRKHNHVNVFTGIRLNART